MRNNNSSRRSFIKQSAMATGAIAAYPLNIAGNASLQRLANTRLPREVWIGGLSQMGLHTATSRLMMEEVKRILEDIFIYQPDILCLPEVFPTANTSENLTLPEQLEICNDVLQEFSRLAERQRCYVICPVYTVENGKTYNAAVVFNRDGSKQGEYRKIHLTEDEIAYGLTPGPLDPPVFQAEFGKFGIQICFDILWDDGWEKLRHKGADIVFWPSAYAGGQMVNAKAWQHKYVVASSTRHGTAKICDISGETLVHTGRWDSNMYCEPVNLEKVFLHTWPYVAHFGAIRKKYGKKVRITNYHEEEWSVIESLAPDVFVADILKEFNLKTHEQHTRDAETAQIKARQG
ncbi:MAG TPA: carbon-nitrogen hydrolase family protein [Bacteroidales bacterium]|nr:carbon-nitrogen hydrolase family protein [Bacteroidales bacterium]